MSRWRDRRKPNRIHGFSTVSPRGQGGGAAPDRLQDVGNALAPSVELDGPNLILDIGGGEFGLYSYSMDPTTGLLVAGGAKRKSDLHAALAEIEALGSMKNT